MKNEKEIFFDFYNSSVSNKGIFKKFIEVANKTIFENKINPDKIRGSIRDNEACLMLGQRNVFSYKEVDGKSIVAYLMNKGYSSSFESHPDFKSKYEYRGQPNQNLVWLNINKVEYLKGNLTDHLILQVDLYHNHIKDSREAEVHKEAKTTNDYLKSVFLKNLDLKLNHINPNKNNIYKFSMGDFLKKPWARELSLAKIFEDNKWAVMGRNTGKKQGDKWVNQVNEGDYIYITYGHEKLSYLAKINSQCLSLPDDIRTKIGHDEYCYREYEIVTKPIINNTNSLSDDKRAWLPSGYTTLYQIDDLNEANKVLFKPFYEVEFMHTQNKNNMTSEDRFFENYSDFAYKNKDNARESTIENYIDFLKEHLEPWCATGRVNYSDLVSYSQKEILKAINIIYEGRNNFKGVMRFEQYLRSLSTNVSKQFPLNQILYGAPGTGKTFSTKEKSVEIVNPSFVANNKDEEDYREIIVEEYNRLINLNQICFTTFHQSMSYEDFIEGIKPVTTPENSIIYKVQEGIFKSLCTEAIKTPKENNFKEVYDKFIDFVVEEENFELLTLVQKKPFNLKVNSNKTAVAIPKTERATEMSITENMLKDYLINGKVNDWKPYTTAIGKYIIEQFGFKQFAGTDNTQKKFVIIIDEINRGNVASIFGELITLIEPDKRKGQKEAIEVKLPYSKELFSVPSNVYIIGTMNTADRSVEALDSALRRRFSFEEIMPNPEVLKGEEVEGINITKLLTKINNRIEELLDRDHQIGHSYFFKVKDSNDKVVALKDVFKFNIIPLLQEYFYNDYEKIALILGKGFVKLKNKPKDGLFASIEGVAIDIEIEDSFELKTVDEKFDIISALTQLMA